MRHTGRRGAKRNCHRVGQPQFRFRALTAPMMDWFLNFVICYQHPTTLHTERHHAMAALAIRGSPNRGGHSSFARLDVINQAWHMSSSEKFDPRRCSAYRRRRATCARQVASGEAPGQQRHGCSWTHTFSQNNAPHGTRKFLTTRAGTHSQLLVARASRPCSQKW